MLTTVVFSVSPSLSSMGGRRKSAAIDGDRRRASYGCCSTRSGQAMGVTERRIVYTAADDMLLVVVAERQPPTRRRRRFPPTPPRYRLFGPMTQIATGQGTDSSGVAGHGLPPGRPHRRRKWLAPLLATVVLAASAGFAIFSWMRAHSTQNQQQTRLSTIRVTGIPADIPTHLANLMGLQPEKRLAAPNFTLTDQAGRTISLSEYRGHPVVLTFFDPHCHTECPLVSQEFVDAEHDLAGAHAGVVFLAVNVNRHALGVATVLSFSREHRLTTIPTWHFLTGSLQTLERIWRNYGIEVATRIVHGHWTVVHTSMVFFISPSGMERYIAASNSDYHNTPTHRAYLPQLTLSAWGRGIALVTKAMAH